MWTHTHPAETTAPPQAVWRVLRDLDNWARWDTSMERVALQGPFEVGSRVSMTPKGQEPIVSVITAVEEDRLYADETEFGGVTLRFSHTLTPLPEGGTRVVHRLEITGAGADEVGPELGPAITEDFPQAMDALLACVAAS
ncbi:SRPBCC family protein [Streptomyces chattanoogensis]|uniref:Polyketide cyclase n=1 Tax=Streptomyces chattanoogensis TaxID=66876 RepID=A0A0N0XX16_9ACTN|nr:SRPBCC family protein [Streptomyces chattanoogensis]KPC62884.1 polyketide cyclase [Streptomyces chattanoogensis]